MQKTRQTRRIVICALIAALVVMFGILTATLASCMLGSGRLSDKDDIAAKIEAAEGGGAASHDKVVDYLRDFGIGAVEVSKFSYVESLYEALYDGELPGTKELAINTAKLFLEHYYDDVKGKDKAQITDALLKCYVGATGDKYGVYRTAAEYEKYAENASGEFVGIGVEVIQEYVEGTYNVKTVEVNKVMKGAGAEAAGVKVGDFITHVEGVPVTDFNGDELVFAIRGEIGSFVKITVLRGAEAIDFSIERRKIVETSVEYEILSGNIGYIAITGFKDNTPDQFRAAMNYVKVRGVSGIVFDLRNNPGGGLISVCEVISELVPKGTHITSYESGDNLLGSESATGDDTKLEIPIVVLCNKNTASAGELFTSAMRDYNDMGILDAKIVGEVTYGKGVMQSTYPVKGTIVADGSTLTLTIAHYNSPIGENYDGVGITPDVKIVDTDGTVDWVERAREELLSFIEELDDTYPDYAVA